MAKALSRTSLRMAQDKPRAQSRRGRLRSDAAQLSVRLPPELRRALDDWIDNQPDKIGRQEAIRAFIVAGLNLMGGSSAPLARLASSDQYRKPDAYPMAPLGPEPPSPKAKSAKPPPVPKPAD